MKIELHMLQNFAPSCLNRDDTGAPKDCQFGGVRRARISSQCIKRAVRNCFSDQQLLPPENLASRTKRVAEAAGKLLAERGRDPEQAIGVVRVALGGTKLSVDDDGQTQYLLFISRQGIEHLADLCDAHWDTLAKLAAESQAAEESSGRGKAKKAKRKASDAVPDEIKKALEDFLDATRAADIAMFGRMLADMPGSNIDAACQVAHAISTHRAAMEMDFFTAVDDLKTDEEDAGAGMMGTIGYNSACFYRYAVVDLQQLECNLAGDAELARRTVEAFLRASAEAVPTGKQNTFAAHSRPDFVLGFVRRKGQPLSLANAFVDPAGPSHEGDMVQRSLDKLSDYWTAVNRVYGSPDDYAAAVCCGTRTPKQNGTGWQQTETYDQFVKAIMEAIR